MRCTKATSVDAVRVRRACVAAAGGRCPPRRRAPPPARFADLFHSVHAAVSQEVVLEGLLHVTSVQAGSCMERFGDLEISLHAPAMSLNSSTSALAGSSWAGDGAATTTSLRERLVSEAVCLATPPDSPAESEPELPALRRLRARAAAWADEAEDWARLEAAACQRAVLAHGIYSAEVISASAAIRRQRRRVLVRALRAGRQRTQALLSSLGTLDADDDAVRVRGWPRR